jgi:hypothetical protein
VYKYWEFQIPAVLDNGILSRPSKVIHKKPRKLVDKDGQRSVVITWKIAEAGGIQTQKQDAKSADDLLAM